MNSSDLNEEMKLWPTGDWPTSSLVDQGINSSKIDALKTYVNTRDITLHSMLIIKNGYLVEEEYFGGNGVNIPHSIYSCTKSITSTLIGIALDQGHLTSLNQTVLDFFPNRTINNLDSRKQNITINNLLTMTDGFSWNEWYLSYSNPGNSFFKINLESDWVQFILDRPMVKDPGTSFNYNTGASHLLSAIIEASTGFETDEYARQFLFEPLNITNYIWNSDPTGLTKGGEGLSLTARDMAKFGYLYLNNGTWNGSQIVPSEWVTNATTKHISTYLAKYDYGYQWWVRDEHYSIQHYSALGYIGQRIFIVPEKDLVVVFTSNEPIFDIHLKLLEDYIIPATKESTTSDQRTSHISLFLVFVSLGISTIFFSKRKLR